MMTILQDSKPFECSCKWCGYCFEYEREDVLYSFENADVVYEAVKCPKCGDAIQIDCRKYRDEEKPLAKVTGGWITHYQREKMIVLLALSKGKLYDLVEKEHYIKDQIKEIFPEWTIVDNKPDLFNRQIYNHDGVHIGGVPAFITMGKEKPDNRTYKPFG